MSRQAIRDPWALPGDVPPAWQVRVGERAAEIGQDVTRDVRWALFAVQTLAGDLRREPGGELIRRVLLLGPLANGVVLGRISLLIFLGGALPQAEREAANRTYAAFAVAAQRHFGLSFELLALSEQEASAPEHWPPQWEVMRDDCVEVFPG